MFPDEHLTEPYGELDHEERELQRPACGYTWWADGREEDGAWWPINEDDLYCPCCGVEGEA